MIDTLGPGQPRLGVPVQVQYGHNPVDDMHKGVLDMTEDGNYIFVPEDGEPKSLYSRDGYSPKTSVTIFYL